MKFKIITFGCRTNQAESRLIGEKLINAAMRQSSNEAMADVMIINTCCVTRKAEKEVRQAIRKIKKENPNCFLVVCGCWVEKIKDLRSKIKDLRIDLLIRNKDKKKIDKILKKQFNHSAIQPFNHSIYQDKYFKSKKALVKIQDGCDNFCTYCIVPYVRSRAVIRSKDKIIKEIKRLVNQGIEEVVLTGINLSSYKINDFINLLKSILKQTKVKTISFGSISIELFDKELIDFISQNPVISSHFHIPLQSACNKTLKRMGRRYKISNFKFLIAKLKKKIPGFTFSTDIMVGFPGETEEEFKESLAAIKEIKRILRKRFTKIHVFRYSSREGTVAARMLGIWGKVSEKVKKQRSAKIAEII